MLQSLLLLNSVKYNVYMEESQKHSHVLTSWRSDKDKDLHRKELC